MIALNIDCAKIPKDKIREKGNGKYLDLVLFDNRSGTDEFGNDGFVAVSVSKEERKRGECGPIIGNWKHIGQKQAPPRQAQRQPARKPHDPDLDGDQSPW